MRIYLDHNATTPLDSEVRAAIAGALEAYGNPSSQHAEGRAARQIIERGRHQVAALMGGSADEVVFTAGGTEADCLGIIGLARIGRGRGRRARVISAAIEHPAVAGAVQALSDDGFEPVLLPVDDNGRADLDAVERACRDGASVLTLALANHELGTVQDIAQVAALCTEHGVLMHCDAVQAAGKRPILVRELGVDAMAISAHKLYGPKGIGALWIRSGLDLAPLVPAGHQERERRPGTENLLGAVGFGAAAAIAGERGIMQIDAIRGLAETLEASLLAIEGVRIHGRGAERIGNTVNAGFDGALGESVTQALDLAGFAVSTGAACTSGSVEPSAVLLGLGLGPERAREAVRFSLGRHNTQGEVHQLLEVLPAIVARARKFR